MNIFLWGAYQQGNFGDDLMAWVFYRGLTSLGHKVVVYGLTESEAIALGIQTTNDLDVGVSECDVVIIGGGAVLEKWWSIKDIARSMLVSKSRKFELEYWKLKSCIDRHNKKIGFLSIGSDGIKDIKEISPLRSGIVRSDRLTFGTVRIKEDLKFFPKIQNSIEYFPDILFATPKILNDAQRPKAPFQPKRILLNLHKRHETSISMILSVAKQLWPNVEVTSIKSHLADAKLTYEWSPPPDSAIKELPYTGVISMIDALQSSDIVISSKLHIGIVGLSYGAVFYSLGGRSKVLSQLSELSLVDDCYIANESPDVETFRDRLNRFSKIQKVVQSKLPHLSDLATMHFTKLKV